MVGKTNSDNKFGLSPYIVGTVLGDGCNYTSIQTAINDINAAGGAGTIYIRVGAYTESPTLSGNIHIFGAQTSGDNGAVAVTGTFTIAAGFGGAIENLTIIGAVDVTAAGSVSLEDCSLIRIGGSALIISGGSVTADNCDIFGTVSAVDISGSSSLFENCFFISGVAVSGTATPTFEKSRFSSTLTTSGTSSSNVRFCDFANAGLSNITIGLGSSVRCIHSVLNSSVGSGFPITGTGTLSWADLVFPGTAQIINPTITSTKLNWQPYGESGVLATAYRGTAAFDSTAFTVTNGFVQASGSLATTYNGTVGSATPVAGVLNIVGGSISRVLAAGSTLTINSPQWASASASFLGVANTGTFITSAGVTLTLPLTPGLGKTIHVIVSAATTVVLQAGVGQTIRIGNLSSSVGGTATSTAQGDAIHLLMDSTNNTWWSDAGPQGNWTLA